MNCREGDGEARYEIVLEEARVVRQIFEWVGRDGLSIGEVCRRLKEQGILSPKGKSYWDRTTVWGHLKNSAYRGFAIYGKTRICEKGQFCGHREAVLSNHDEHTRSTMCPKIRALELPCRQSLARISSLPLQKD